MSVEQTNVIDAIGIEKESGLVILTISDHLEWDLANKHLLILQEKINSYLRFVESGEIFDAYPQAHGKQIVVSVMALHSPIADAFEFLDRAKNTIEKAGFGFRFQHREMSSESE